jgi:hypothetical protein
LAKLAIILVVVLIVVLASGNCWLPYVVGWQIRCKTGFRAHVNSSRGSLFRGYLDFRDFDILNPKGKFDSKSFVSFKELSADVNLRSLFTGTLILDKVVINLDSVTLVKNTDGVYNGQLFAKNTSSHPVISETILNDVSVTRKRKPEARKNTGKIHLNKVIFTLKSVKIIDESGTDPTKEFTLNYHRKFTNVEDVNTVIKSLTTDLSKYGVSIFVQSVFNSVLHLPGVDRVTGGITTIKNVSKGTIRDIETGIKHLFKK